MIIFRVRTNFIDNEYVYFDGVVSYNLVEHIQLQEIHGYQPHKLKNKQKKDKL